MSNSLPLTAGDLCTRIVVFADRAMMLVEAARLMRTHDVGSLVVIDERSPAERIVVGMLTDRDIAIEVVAAGRDPHALRVGEVMRTDPVTAREQDAVLEALAAMRRRKVRRVPVTGPQGQLVGLLAADDILAAIAEQMQALSAAVGAQQPQLR